MKTACLKLKDGGLLSSESNVLTAQLQISKFHSMSNRILFRTGLGDIECDKDRVTPLQNKIVWQVKWGGAVTEIGWSPSYRAD